MIFRAFEVESWGCFDASASLGPFVEGINVIHGPNGIGKSTLAAAVSRGLFDRHKVSGSEADALRPWGRDVAPRIRIEFDHAGTAYRLEKRFCVAPFARLERREGSRFVLLAEGEATEEKVREMLGATAPLKGLSKSANWGIAQVLWAPQGELHPECLGRDAADRLRSALGVSAFTPEGRELERRVELAFLRVFTPTGQLRRGQGAPPLAAIREQLEQATARLDDARLKLASLEEASCRLDERRARRATLEEERAVLLPELQKVKASVEEYRGLVSEQRRLEAEEKERTQTCAAILSRIEALERVRGRRRDLEGSREKLDACLPQLRRLVEEAEARMTESTAHVEEVRAKRSAVEVALAEANDAKRLTTAAERTGALEARLSRIDDAIRRRDEAMRAVETLRAPTRAEIAAIRKAVSARDQAKWKLESTGLSLEIQAEASIVVEIESGEDAGPKRLIPGGRLEIRGSPDVRFRVPGVGRIRASGPASDASDLRRALDETETAVQDLVRPFGTTDLEGLERLAEVRERVESASGAVEGELRTLLDGDAIPALHETHAKLLAETEEILARRPAWRGATPSPDALERAHQSMHDAFVRDVDAAEAARDRSIDELRGAERERDLRSSETGVVGRALETTLDDERRLAGEDGLDDVARASARDRAAVEWAAARASLEAIGKRLAEFPDDPARSAGRLTARLVEIDDQARQARDLEKLAEGALKEREAMGLYSEVSRLEEEVARLDLDEARERVGA